MKAIDDLDEVRMKDGGKLLTFFARLEQTRVDCVAMGHNVDDMRMMHLLLKHVHPDYARQVAYIRNTNSIM